MKKKTHKQLISDFKKVHKNRYDYSIVKYINMNTKIDIICKEHGIFKQTPSSHYIRKNNCPICAKIETSKYTLKTLNQLIIDFKRVHGGLYNYSKVKYINMNTKIDIICRKHGVFKQLPLNHLHSKTGCPICRESKGEKEISKILNNLNILYIQQKRFKNCKNIRTLPFDFYLSDYNICIEFDGIQHSKCSDHFGGKRTLLTVQYNDNIKNQYCLNNNIILIRIDYKSKIKINSKKYNKWINLFKKRK